MTVVQGFDLDLDLATETGIDQRRCIFAIHRWSMILRAPDRDAEPCKFTILRQFHVVASPLAPTIPGQRAAASQPNVGDPIDESLVRC